MLSRRLHWRALVGLGALLMVICVWPVTCAALPIPITSTIDRQNTAASENPNEMMKFISVLSTSRNSNNNNISDSISNIRTYSNNTILTTKIPQKRYANISRLRKTGKRLFAENQRTPHTIKHILNIEKSEKNIDYSQNESEIKIKHTTTSELNLDATTIQTTLATGNIASRRQTPTMQTANIQKMKSKAILLAEHSLQEQLEPTTVTNNNNNTETNAFDHAQKQQHSLMVTATNKSKHFLNIVKRMSDAISLPSSTTQSSSLLLNNKNSNAQKIGFRNDRSITSTNNNRKKNSNLDRNERSANLSQIMGTARKIQLLMKNRLIQILPDGTVNGTQDDSSDYSEYFHTFIYF